MSQKLTEWQKEFRRKKRKEQKPIENKIIKLLKEYHPKKMRASNLDAHLKHNNVDEIKEICENIYDDGKIGRTFNFRYFILSEEKGEAKAEPKMKSKTKPDYLKDISVLVDLLEDDTLTKEVFIKKIREKLK